MNKVTLDDAQIPTPAWIPGRLYRHRGGEDAWIATEENDLVCLRTGETYAHQGEGFGATGQDFFELLPPGTRVTIEVLE